MSLNHVITRKSVFLYIFLKARSHEREEEEENWVKPHIYILIYVCYCASRETRNLYVSLSCSLCVDDFFQKAPWRLMILLFPLLRLTIFFPLRPSFHHTFSLFFYIIGLKSFWGKKYIGVLDFFSKFVYEASVKFRVAAVLSTLNFVFTSRENWIRMRLWLDYILNA